MSDIVRLWKSPAGYAQGIHALFQKPIKIVKSEVLFATRDVIQVLESAEKEAEQIIKDANVRAQQNQQHAFNEGVQKGYNEVVNTLVNANTTYEKARKDAEKDAIKFAFQVAERIIGRALERDPSLISSIVAEVLSEANDQKNIVVLTHPEDLKHLQENREKLLQHTNGNHIHFEISERVQKGECIIETDDGSIDGRLEIQLNALRAALLDEEEV